ncbi:hypothetical protein R1sor_015220 [Riccia sorocarpa]|uniref:DRBM domain-containing protein n=1 Tax=Riccia sorocarpa TaxID=122646 RepID=A0ABD3HDJ8_9MARC
MTAGEETPRTEVGPASPPPATSVPTSPTLPVDETPWDLSNSTPIAFTHILKTTFSDGKERAAKKFQSLRIRVTLSLPTAPPPGPSTFAVKCLEALLSLDPPFNEGLSHLLTSAINHLDSRFKTDEDVKYSRRLAAFMFKNAVTGVIFLDARILVRLVVVFGIQLKDVGEVATPFDADENSRIQVAKDLVSPFILSLVKDRAYTSAVALLKQFDLQDCTPRDFLTTMVTDGEPDLAGQWAAHMGIDMCCYLVQQCTEMGQYKVAHRLVQRYKLEHHFPDSYILYKQSSLRKLAGRGLWDVAESIAQTDSGLQEYLVALAVEEGDTAQAAELCERFQMEQLPTCSVIKDPSLKEQYIKLSDVMPTDKVCWVDSIESLASAKEHFRNADIVGLDSEWKANHVKGTQENKVAILQLATPKRVFVFDMLQLSEELPEALDDCLKVVFHEPNVLKLGYAVNNDLERLVHSYQGLECFSLCESLLDLQTFAGHTKGGLSGLAKLAVGGYLDKRARMSDWEKRPLTEKQLQYAALDAAVLVSIFEYLQTAPDSDGTPLTRDYKPYLKTFRVPQKRSKKVTYEPAHSYDVHDERGGNEDQSGARCIILNCSEEVDIGGLSPSHESSAAVTQNHSEESDLMGKRGEDIDGSKLINGDDLGTNAAEDFVSPEPSIAAVDSQSELCKRNLELLGTSVMDTQPGQISSSPARTDLAEVSWCLSASRSCLDDQVTDVRQGTRVNNSAGADFPRDIATKGEVIHTYTTERGDELLDTTGIPPKSQKDSEPLAVHFGGTEHYGELTSICEPLEESEMFAVADLVSATFELVGEPRPGLLKSKLQEFTQAAGFPLPLYQAESYGPGHLLSFRCAVEVGGFRFSGKTAFKKKDAELFAAQKALSFFQAEALKYSQQQKEEDIPTWIRTLKTSDWHKQWGHLAVGTYRSETESKERGSNSATFLASAETGYHRRFRTRVEPPRSFWFTTQLTSSGTCSAVNSSFLGERIAYRARQGRCNFYCGPSIGVQRLSHIFLLL